MTIDLSQLNTYLVVLMPVIVSFLAGAIRQDKLPQLINEAISVVVALVLAALQALLGGKLGGSPFADFGIVAAYTISLLHSAPFQALQKQVQTNVLSTGKPAPQPVAPQPQIVFDAQKVAEHLISYLSTPAIAAQIVQQLPMPQLAAMLKNELVKAGKVVPSSQIPNLPTQNVPLVNPPPAQGG